jgi:hypothetical protein
MCQILYLAFNVFLGKKPSYMTFLAIGLITLAGCNLTDRKYTIDEQYNLAASRIDGIKEQLGFSFNLEKDTVYLGEKIFFTAHFANKTNAPITLRIPRQSGVRDFIHPSTLLEYSITPLDKTISLRTSLSGLGTVYIVGNPVQSSEFEILDSYATKEVKLELPNIAYLKRGETWVESALPPGQYSIQLKYENLFIGYEIKKEDQTYFLDESAWVGQIETEPDILTVLP